MKAEEGSPLDTPLGVSLTNAAKSLSLLVRYEQMVRETYASFAEQFPHNSAFWLAIEADEEEHVAAASELLDMVSTGIIQVELERFDRAEFDEVLESGLAGLPGDQFESGESYACSYALELEQTAVEQKIFKVLESDPPELSRIFWLFQTDYEDHIRRLMSHAERVRRHSLG